MASGTTKIAEGRRVKLVAAENIGGTRDHFDEVGEIVLFYGAD
jgi:hypothetical protein